MRFASSISEIREPEAAAQKILQEVTGLLGGEPCDAAFLFISSQVSTHWEKILHRVWEGLKKPLLLGCTGGGVLGKDQEMEFTPAVSLAAARLPGVELHPFAVTQEDLEEPRGPGFWIEKLGCAPGENPIGILLPEPFSCNVPMLIAALGGAYPKMPLVGGIASGADSTEGTALFFNNQILKEGAVGVLLSGNVTLKTIVSQGCRPIGRPFIITKAEGNTILELAGVPAASALQQLFLSLSGADKELAQKALLIGMVMNEQKEKFERGDFLIRNLVGIDPETGALAVGDQVRVGQTVQFQVRDAETAREDLRHLIKEQSQRPKSSPSAGGLLFSCLGRGRDLFGEPHHDIRTIQSALGPLPMAGFFCNGEIGPIGGRNFIHGFTSSAGLFEPRANA